MNRFILKKTNINKSIWSHHKFRKYRNSKARYWKNEEGQSAINDIIWLIKKNILIYIVMIIFHW